MCDIHVCVGQLTIILPASFQYIYYVIKVQKQQCNFYCIFLILNLPCLLYLEDELRFCVYGGILSKSFINNLSYKI